MRKKRGITYEVVAAIANRLVSDGCKPDEISAGVIRDETDTGSFTTIIAHLKRWRAQSRTSTPGVTLDAGNLSGVTTEVTALIEQACERVRNECRTAAAGEAIEKAKLRAELDEVLRVNDEIEAEREAMAAEIEPLKTELDDAKLLVAELEGQLKGQAHALAVLERVTARTTRDDAGADVSEAKPVDPAVTSAPADAGDYDVLTGGRSHDADAAEEETPPVIEADHAMGGQAEMPPVPNDDAVQANVDREGRG
jgi:hypothetical protein